MSPHWSLVESTYGTIHVMFKIVKRSIWSLCAEERSTLLAVKDRRSRRAQPITVRRYSIVYLLQSHEAWSKRTFLLRHFDVACDFSLRRSLVRLCFFESGAMYPAVPSRRSRKFHCVIVFYEYRPSCKGCGCNPPNRWTHTC